MANTRRVAKLGCVDVAEWHKGRGHFGLWYLPIEGEAAAACARLRGQLSTLFCENYQRQWHITLFVSGFLAHHRKAILTDDIAWQAVLMQAKMLSAQCTPFLLQMGGVDSFDNCTYWAVQPSASLDALRGLLAKNSAEISPSRYTPHITLGFYRENFSWQRVQQAFAKVQPSPRIITPTRLVFGVYNPVQAQGALTELVSVDLATQQLLVNLDNLHDIA